MKHLKKLLLILFMLTLIFGFQNCSDSFSGLDFSSTVGDLVGQNSPCAQFGDSPIYESCLQQTRGFVGRLYYLEDKSDGVNVANYVYSKNDEAIAFDSTALYSVNVILDKGFVSNSYILMTSVSIPHTTFDQGFQIAPNQYLTDNYGKKLIEAFALDLHARLQLPETKSPGLYEIAIISDDGALLDINLESSFATNIINNDGYQSSKMACSNRFLNLSYSSSLPIRLRYYQGPRSHISLTILMREIINPSLIPGETDELCGQNTEVTDFDKLAQRGWFIPNSSAYGLPTTSQLFE